MNLHCTLDNGQSDVQIMTKVGEERKRSSLVGAGLEFKGGGLLAPGVLDEKAQ